MRRSIFFLLKIISFLRRCQTPAPTRQTTKTDQPKSDRIVLVEVVLFLVDSIRLIFSFFLFSSLVF
jgi:hypothetical protein